MAIAYVATCTDYEHKSVEVLKVGTDLKKVRGYMMNLINDYLEQSENKWGNNFNRNLPWNEMDEELISYNSNKTYVRSDVHNMEWNISMVDAKGSEFWVALAITWDGERETTAITSASTKEGLYEESEGYLAELADICKPIESDMEKKDDNYILHFVGFEPTEVRFEKVSLS